MKKDSINAKFHNLASYLYLTSVTPSRSSGLIPIRGVVPGLLLSSADIYSLPLLGDSHQKGTVFGRKVELICLCPVCNRVICTLVANHRFL